MSWEDIVKGKNTLKEVLGNKQKAIDLLVDIQNALEDSQKFISAGSAGGKRTPMPEEDKYGASYNQLVAKVSGQLADVIRGLHNLNIEGSLEILMQERLQ